MNDPEGEDLRASTERLRSATAEILSRSASETSPVVDIGCVDVEPAAHRRAFDGAATASAYDAALRLLGVRARSRAELLSRLREKDFPAEEIDSVMVRLDRAGLLDDEDFAEQWVRSRHLHSGKGRTALRHELRHKGVEQVVIEQALSQVDDDAERDRAAELLRRKTIRLGSEDVVDRGDRDNHTRRLVSMLVRRGYSPSLALDLVRTELDRLRS